MHQATATDSGWQSPAERVEVRPVEQASAPYDIPQVLLDRIRATRALPTISAVAMKVVEVCGDENSGLGDIARVIQLDPALAAKMLRYANSPYLAPRTPVTTIMRAVTTLGLVSVQTLSVSFMLVNEMTRARKGAMKHRRYWTRSLLSAVAGRTIAGALGARGAEEAFVAALLQDVGILILERSLGESYATLHNAAGGDHQKLIELEREALGVDHSVISAWLADEWKLPKVFALAALGSHGFLPREHAEDPLLWNLCQSVSLSGHVADLWLSKDASGAGGRVRGAALKHIGLGPERVERIVKQTAGQFAEAARTIEVSDVSPAVVAEVVAKAQELLVGLALRTAEERGQLEENARRDALTGLFNRGHLQRALPRLFEDSTVHGLPLTLAMVDIDNFKAINDQHGHPAGDQVIQVVAECIAQLAREDDVMGRFGGEEFLLLFPATTAEGARTACNRLCERIESVRIKLASGVSVSVTVSIGIATNGALGQSAQGLLEGADQALYRAKRAGKNRVEGG